MLKSWRLGRVFGFPVEINLSFLLLLAVVFIAFGGFTGVFIVSLAFASVLVHELGHALVARRLGVHVSGIELSFFGGAAKMMDMPRRPDHEIAIAAAGPAVSLMIAGAGLGLGALLHGTGLAGALLWTIGMINLVLAAFNLIPAVPMDGGRILRALLSRRMSFVRATDIAVKVSRVVAVAFAAVGILGLISGSGTYQLLILAPFLWMMASREQIVARHSAGPYGHGGFDVIRRARDDRGFGSGFRRGFDHDDFDDGSGPRGPVVRRFTIRQVGGRTVIETLD